MRKFLFSLVFSLVTSSAMAGTITFGQSWDGTPPGDISMIMGVSGWADQNPLFAPGVYDVNFNGGISAWFLLDEVSISSGPTLQPHNTIRFTATTPWFLVANTPDLHNAPSTGIQFAFHTISDRVTLWALEDIKLNRSDADFNDAYGAIERISDDVHIDPHTDPPSTVPEPTSLIMLGSALIFGARKLRRTH